MCILLFVYSNTHYYVEAFPFFDHDAYQYDESDYDYTADESGFDQSGEKSSADKEIVVVPKFVSESKSFVFDQGKSIRLPCNVDILPEGYQIIWKKITENGIGDGKLLTIGTKSYYTNASAEQRHTGTRQGSTLEISHADEADGGRYKCILASQSQNQIVHNVSIRVPPRLKLIPANGVLKAREGQTVSLKCFGEGKPEPKIKWMRQGRRLPDGRQAIEAEELELIKVSRKDSGQYICSASNGHGNGTRAVMKLTVEYAPEVKTQELYIHAKMGHSNLELVCLVFALPKAKVTWSKDGVPIVEGRNFKTDTFLHRHVLTIGTLGHDDFGNYSCKASNKYGIVEKNLEVSGKVGFVSFKNSAHVTHSTSFLVEWVVESYSVVSKFSLRYRQSVSFTWIRLLADSLPTDSHTYMGKIELIDLQPSTQYEFKVASLNDAG